MKNKYICHSHNAERKFREIVRCFEHDFTSQETTNFTGILSVTVGKIYVKLRKRILALVDESPVDGEVELDEIYFSLKESVESASGGWRQDSSKIFSISILKSTSESST